MASAPVTSDGPRAGEDGGQGVAEGSFGEILGADANLKIYDAVDPVERENAGLYRLTIPFRIRTEGVISSFSLGALGIRDGSERIHFGEQLLLAGEDYVIDYDIGQLTLLRPGDLFAGALIGTA